MAKDLREHTGPQGKMAGTEGHTGPQGRMASPIGPTTSQAQIAAIDAARSKRLDEMFAQMSKNTTDIQANKANMPDDANEADGAGASPPGLPQSVVSAGASYLSIFDLYDVTDTTVKVRGFATGSHMLAVNAGVHLVVTGGSVTFDQDITISANTYIYIQINRAGGAAAMYTSASMGNGTSSTEKYYLWYIPWDTDHIDSANIMNLQGMPRWVAGA